MKKILLSFLLLFGIITLYAVPAYPELIVYTQPDNSKIFIYLKGDEKVHWAETIDGYSIINQNGYFYYATADAYGNMISSGIIARNPDERTIHEKNFLASTPKKLTYSPEQVKALEQIWEYQRTSKSFPTTGNRKLICILMEFQDVHFTLSQTDFYNLFNQIGYNYNNATGSVKDYYLEVSYNQLNLTTDVVGPFRAQYDMAYYGGLGHEREFATEAILAADSVVNYADYDNDNDGEVDGIYIIFAGYGEEAGASSDAIWSHAWYINPVTLDGVVVSRYSCSPELRGNSGTNITRIGVICHEFGHVLGAPDFYDTNYSTGGQYEGTGYWDMMASGSWNNNGATPAHHNGFTKTYIYNWATPIELDTAQIVTLYNAEQYPNSFYIIKTKTNGEFFFIEYRHKHLFDSYIPGSGMIIYHVHKDVFNSGNSINATHPQKMYPVAQNATSDPTYENPNYGTINSATCAWTGLNGSKTAFNDYTKPSMKNWNQQPTGKPISDIYANFANKTITFNFNAYGCQFPQIQASNLTVTEQNDFSLGLQWQRGSGDSVIVFASKYPIEFAPTNSYFYTADNFFGNSPVEQNIYCVYKGTGNSFTLNGLIPGTQYYIALTEFSSTNCYLTPLYTQSLTTSGNSLCSYCSVSSPGKGDRGITFVQFNEIENPSSSSPYYSEFLNIYTTLEKGKTYSLSVRVNTVNSSNYKVKAWIDWNQNCTFDTDEAYDLGSASYGTDTLTSLSPLSITVPLNALEGYTVMRIRSRNTSAPNPCGAILNSETEDYLIKVVAPTTVEQVTNNFAVVYPVPSNLLININLNTDKLATYEIYNINGLKIDSGKFSKNTQIKIDNKGIYFLKIKTTDQQQTFKLIIN